MTRDEVRRIAALAQLEFDDDGLDRMAAEMSAILDYIDQLEEVAGIAPESGGATLLREDEVRPGVERAAVARNAPAWHDGQFVVPKVIE